MSALSEPTGRTLRSSSSAQRNIERLIQRSFERLRDGIVLRMPSNVENGVGHGRPGIKSAFESTIEFTGTEDVQRTLILSFELISETVLVLSSPLRERLVQGEFTSCWGVPGRVFEYILRVSFSPGCPGEIMETGTSTTNVPVLLSTSLTQNNSVSVFTSLIFSLCGPSTISEKVKRF